jgi:hypothetical protein
VPSSDANRSIEPSPIGGQIASLTKVIRVTVQALVQQAQSFALALSAPATSRFSSA